MPDAEEQLSRIASELDEVERTLHRLDEGRLPACQVCGAPLHDEPLRARCGQHADLQGPVAVLAPAQPFPLGGQQPQG